MFMLLMLAYLYVQKYRSPGGASVPLVCTDRATLKMQVRKLTLQKKHNTQINVHNLQVSNFFNADPPWILY